MTKKPARYSPELRAEVVKAVIECRRTYADVARDFGLVAETVGNWVVAEKKITRERATKRVRRSTALKCPRWNGESVSWSRKRTSKKLRPSSRENNGSERYELIAAEKVDFEVTMMCELLDVSRSGFYEWYGRAPSAAQR